MQEQVEIEISEDIPFQYNRVKGAGWFKTIAASSAIVLGQGGIGSWVTLFLARAGMQKIYTYDGDLFESHNMTGQFVDASLVGENKATAVRNMVMRLSPSSSISSYPKMYDSSSPSNDIVICGFDNMEARKIAFENWLDLLNDQSEEDKKYFFFQDGRLLAEQLQIFNIPGNRSDLIELYKKEYLFDDSEVEEVSCTFKQTTHCAAIIAGQMVGFLTNYLTSSHQNEFRSVPFYYEYIIPLNKHNKI